MDINDFREKVILSLYGELDESQEKELTRLLEGNSQHISEYRQLVRAHSIAGQAGIRVDEELESAARQRLSGILDEEPSPEEISEKLAAGPQVGFWQRVIDLLLPTGFEGWAKCAVSLAAGLVMGLLFVGSKAVPGFQSVPDLATLGPETLITDVRFIPASESGNDVELSFSATRNYSFVDSIDSPRVQQLLAYSLIRESNPGERIRTVEVLGDTAGPGNHEIKRALLSAVITDENPVVRQQALAALRKYQPDSEVQGTLIDVLRFDENSRVRMEAVNMLSDSIAPGERLPAKNLEAVKKQSEVEDNYYMKVQLNNILEKVSLEQL